MNLHSWSPATDTTELATVYRGPWFDRPTEELHLLDLYPEVTARYERPTRFRKFGRRLVKVTAVLCGLLALAATPAKAAPVLDDLTYRVICTQTIAWPVSQQLCVTVLR